MAISFTQNSAGRVCGNFQFCTPLFTGGTSLAEMYAVDGGSTGGTTTVTLLSEQIDVRQFIECDVDAGVSWNAGTWTVRWNVTTANMNMSIASVYLCRVNSSCVNQESLGSATGLSISLGTTGVKTQTVSGSGASPSAGDKVIIVFGVSNSSMSTQSVVFTCDQNIDSPFTTPIPVGTKHTVNVSQAVARAGNW